MDSLRVFLFVLTVGGAVVTIWGFVEGYRGARREYAEAQRRIDALERLSALSRAEHEPRMEAYRAALRAADDRSAVEALHKGLNDQRNSAFDAVYRSHGLSRTTAGNLTFIAAYESRRLLGLVLDSTGRDFLIAGIGLVISTVASAWSLFLT